MAVTAVLPEVFAEELSELAAAAEPALMTGPETPWEEPSAAELTAFCLPGDLQPAAAKNSADKQIANILRSFIKHFPPK
jgi:hypothetical protein